MPGPDLEPYLDVLRALPFVREARVAERSARRSAAPDATVVLRTPAGEARVAVEATSSGLTRALAERLVHLGERVPHLLVLAPAIGRELGELLAGRGIDFVDLAGNCHVHVGEQYLAHVEGRRAPARPKTARALRAPALRVVLALLAEPALVGATTRVLAKDAGGVSPQTASDVRAKLLADGALLRTRVGLRWAPHGWRAALELFLVGYPGLAQSLAIGRYRSAARDVAAVERELAGVLSRTGAWRWGGAAAASRMEGHYRGDRTVAYLRDADRARALRLPMAPDPQGPIALYRAPGPLALEGTREDCVHPVLVYAELLAEGNERAREAAGAIHDRFLVEIASRAT